MLSYKNRPTVDDFIKEHGDQFPLLHAYSETRQDPVWHAEGNVHIHTDMVLTELYELLSDVPEDWRDPLMYAAAFHDYAKSLTTRDVERDGRICVTAKNHEGVGASHIALMADMDVSWWKRVVRLIECHQMPKHMVLKEKGEGAYLKLLLDVKNFQMLYILALADIRGRTCVDFEEQLMYLEEFKATYEFYGLSTASQHRWDFSHLSHEQYYRAIDEMGGRIHTMDEVLSLPFNFEETPEVVIMCGLPGSGKSTLSKKLEESGYKVISLDDLRNSEEYPNATDIFREHLRNCDKIVWDATNYRTDFRTKISRLGMQYGAFVSIRFIDHSVPYCIRRDRERERTVGKEVIINQADKFQLPRFEEVHYVG